MSCMRLSLVCSAQCSSGRFGKADPSVLPAVDDDAVPAVASPPAGAAAPGEGSGCAVEECRRVFRDRRLHSRLRGRHRASARRRCDRRFHRVPRHLDEILGAFVLAVFVAHLRFEAERAASRRREPAADLGSKRPSDKPTQPPPANSPPSFAAPFNHPPTDCPMGERTTLPSACPAFLITSPMNRSSSASLVIPSSSPLKSVTSASLNTSASLSTSASLNTSASPPHPVSAPHP